MACPWTISVRPLRHRDKGQLAGLANRLAQLQDLGFVGRAGQLDDDPVSTLDLDDRFGHAVLVDAVFDDAADRLHVIARDRMVGRGNGAVLGAQAALQVKPEVRLDKGACRAQRRRQVQDVDRQRGEANAHDQKRDEATEHRPRTISMKCRWAGCPTVKIRW